MSTAILEPLTNNLADVSSRMTDCSPKPRQPSEKWPREPISLMRRGVYSRLVIFDGKDEPYIEQHFGLASDSSGRDPDFDALVQARWYEYLAEGYLKTMEWKMAASGSKTNETRINEPVQLYLADRRLARAKLEIKIYTRLLKRELGPLLRKRFEVITEQSLPAGGLFGEAFEVSPGTTIFT